MLKPKYSSSKQTFTGDYYCIIKHLDEFITHIYTWRAYEKQYMIVRLLDYNVSNN